ncbi:MAG: hypothetical protein ACP5JG_12760 [Anaerolineae bacterium]
MTSPRSKRWANLFLSILHTYVEEIGCDTCFEHIDRYVELILAGEDAARVMPLVHRHLTACAACREEYEALLSALKLS